MKKLVDLKLTLPRSPPVTSPIHAHRAFQGPTNMNGQPRIIRHLKKASRKTESKTSKQIKGNLEEIETMQGREENKSPNKQNPE